MINSYRHASRYREILATLIRHGLDGLVTPLDVHDLHLWHRVRYGCVPTPAQRAGDAACHAGRDPLQGARHLRLALEELGPTFIKIGQILSTRADLLPPVYIAELAKLQDQTPPVPFADLVPTIEAALEVPLRDAFARIDPQPLATASIGQVHAATLRDGTEVVVKVQRPGVERVIARDLAILLELAHASAKRTRFARQLDLPALATEFAWMLRTELDYVAEGRNAERFARMFAGDRDVSIPRVHWSHTRKRVLTLDRLCGIRINNLPALSTAGYDQRRLAVRVAQLFMREVLEEGFFHADPHPGNLLILADGTIGRLDFGMVGTVDERMREHLMLLLVGAIEREPERIADQLEQMGATGPDTARLGFERDLGHLLAEYMSRPLEEIEISRLIQDLLALIRRNNIRLPADLALLLKTLVMYEALGRQLDPSFDAVAVAEPYLRQIMHRLYSPGYWAQKFKYRPLELMLFSAALPGHLQRLANRLERNELTFRVQHGNLPEALAGLNGMVNRLSLVILVSSLTIGLSILYEAATPPLHRWPGQAFAVGFVLVGLFCLRLLYSIWRSRRCTFK